MKKALTEVLVPNTIAGEFREWYLSAFVDVLATNGLSKREAKKAAEKYWRNNGEEITRSALMQRIENKRLYSRQITFGRLRTFHLNSLALDHPDTDIVTYLNQINLNSDLVTVGSCSGLPEGIYPFLHAGEGHPYVALRFRHATVLDYYSAKILRQGYSIHISGSKQKEDKIYPVISIDIPGTTTRDMLIIGESERNEHMATVKEARRFWEEITDILSKREPQRKGPLKL